MVPTSWPWFWRSWLTSPGALDLGVTVGDDVGRRLSAKRPYQDLTDGMFQWGSICNFVPPLVCVRHARI